MDDILIWSNGFDEHLNRLRAVFERLRTAGVKLKPNKCHFLKTRVNFLGHVISSKGIETDPAKIAALRDWPTPANAKELRSFLGLAGYYRKFIKNFSVTSEPLYRLLKKNRAYLWTEDQEESFQTLKQLLCNPPILASPAFGPEARRFILDTDASTDYGIGAVLSQQQSDGTE